ncbi:MAG: response regulator [Bryobacteraceae bacterium]|nr:response regulator [Bryobacteraceae bacterium]
MARLSPLLSAVFAAPRTCLALIARRLADAGRPDGDTRPVPAEHPDDQLRRTNEELVLALAEARQAAETKSRFLAVVSHEIRTPLNGILGMNELLLCTRMNGEQRQYAEAVKESTGALLRIVNDILDFSKIEAGRLEIENAPFDLLTTLRAVNTMLMPQAYLKGLKLTCEVAPDVPQWVAGDALRVRQVLVNLVGNAVKFTEQGRVSVSVEMAESDETGGEPQVYFSVEDTGIGIGPEHVDKIFHEFAQTDSSTTRRYGGTGLGLSISRRLVEMMGGAMGCESELGNGSAFWFTLPLQAAPAPEEVKRQEAAAGDRTWARRRVLVVEDNPVNRTVAVRLLAREKCEVDAAESGRQAVEACAAGEYDLIFMDVNMPDMDGFQTAAEIRRLENGVRHVPIIAMTARAMDDDRELCLASGMNDYLSKPVSAESLRRVLETWSPKEAVSAE